MSSVTLAPRADSGTSVPPRTALSQASGTGGGRGVASIEPGMARWVGAASGPLGLAKSLPSHQGDSPGSRQNN